MPVVTTAEKPVIHRSWADSAAVARHIWTGWPIRPYMSSRQPHHELTWVHGPSPPSRSVRRVGAGPDALLPHRHASRRGTAERVARAPHGSALHRPPPQPPPLLGWVVDDAGFACARQQLEEYFAGARRCFDVPLALEGSAFEQQVLDALLQVPYAATATYGQIASRIGRRGRLGRWAQRSTAIPSRSSCPATEWSGPTAA